MTTAPASPSAPDRGGFALFLALAVLAASVLASSVALRPPAPLGKDAPPHEFSAARAAEFLLEISGDGKPHPIGSAEGVAVRDRVADAFRRLGLRVEIRPQWVVHRGRAAEVANVEAYLPGGGGSGGWVVVMSHHDSVPAGPGAADDLMSVATSLEVARALRAAPSLPAGVSFLVTDGEEAGLLGARRFSRFAPRDPSADPAPVAVVNLDARGNTGPSLLFETGPRDAEAVAGWSSRTRRPVSSSLFPAVYRSGLVPNDTDFTVPRESGWRGLNFACIGRVQHYHTPLDTLANVDRGMLQHHGENALAAVRALADLTMRPAGRGEGGDAAWCDVLGRFVLRWPLGATPYLAGAALVVLLVPLVVGLRRGQRTGSEAVVALLAQTVAFAAAIGGALVTPKLLASVGAAPSAFVAEPGWSAAAVAGTALALAWTVTACLRGTAPPAAVHVATWIVWSALGLAVAIQLPGGAPLFVVPACVAAAALAVRPRPGAALVPTAVALVLAAPLWLLFGDALGVGLTGGVVCGAVAALAALPVGAFVAVETRRRWLAPAAAAALAVVGFVGGAGAPVATADLPRRLDFVRVVEEGDHHTHVFVRTDDGSVPASLRAAFEFEEEPGRVLPWESGRAPAFEATHLAVPAPVLADVSSTEEGGTRRTRFRIVSKRGASATLLALRPGTPLVSVTVGGTKVPGESLLAYERDAPVLECFTTPPEGVLVELELGTTRPVDAFVADETSGLLPEDAAILAARPADRVPRGRGDRTVALRKLKL